MKEMEQTSKYLPMTSSRNAFAHTDLAPNTFKGGSQVAIEINSCKIRHSEFET